MRNLHVSHVLSACVLMGLPVFSTGCIFPSQSGGAAGGAPSPIPSLSGNTEQVLQTYQPALAVRGINCLLCHAQVNSSIITDFGYGDPQFFVGSTPSTDYGDNPTNSSSSITDNKPLTLPWYGNYFGTWQLATQINGTIVVPGVTITDPTFMSSIPAWNSPSITLAQLLDLDLGAGYYGGSAFAGTGPIDASVIPRSGLPKVQEIDQIYIGAPTAAEILALTPDLTGSTVTWEALASSSSSVTGLVVQAGTGGSYVTNSGPTLVCLGDVVISGTLFLNNVTIETDNNGCRLYVTQSAFIQGQVGFTSTSGTQNLQVSSARGIMSGFDVTTLTTRFGSWYPDAQPLTRGPGTNTQKNALIIAEAQVIGAALYDSEDAAECAGQMVTYVGQDGGSNETLTQCSIHFQRLLLNAPNIESRYIGQFTGVAIAEIALFAPGALNFAYDTTFSSVPILPALISPVLSCTGPFCGGGVLGQ